jgi:glc operon protein GlcG
MTPRLFAIICAAFLIAAPAAAQQTTPPAAPLSYGPPVTLNAAKKIMAAAEAEAVRNNWQVAIAIIDSGGHMVMMQKFDNTQLASIEAAGNKAQTSLAFRLPSKALEDAVAAGGAGLRLLALKNVAPFEGGLPIVIDGKIAGAIGVSGALSSEDAQVARAGLDAIRN